MKLLGAEGRPRRRPARATLKEAMNEAIRDWVANVETTHYLHRLGASARTPIPRSCASLQSRDRARGARADARRGRPAARRRRRLRRRRLERDRHLPRVPRRRRAAGRRRGRRRRRRPARRLEARPVSVLHGSRSYVLCDDVAARSSKRIRSPPGSTTRASAPSTPCWPTAGRARVRARAPTTRRSTRSTASCRTEGIIPALESCPRALRRRAAGARARRRTVDVMVCLSGRGDKDIDTVLARGGE